jgi:sialidase-1
MNTNMFRVFCLPILLFFFRCVPDTEIVKVHTFQTQIPVLTRIENNPVLGIEVIKKCPDTLTLESMELSLEGTTNVNDIQAIRLTHTGSTKRYYFDRELAQISPTETICQLTLREPLPRDTNYLWMTVELKDRVNIDHFIQVQCTKLITNIGQPQDGISGEVFPLRTGIALRKHNDDSVHTFRIPGLATSKKGTLLAIYDARRESSRDLQGHMDIGLNRSTDGGQTWQSMQVVLDMGTWGNLPEKFNGVSDANILVDETTGKIFIAGLWMHGVINADGAWVEGLTDESKDWNHQWRNKGSQPGFGVRETSQFLVTESADDGLSWSHPVNLTALCKREEWWLWAPAPGHGITLDEGTLVFPTQGRDDSGIPFSNITYSLDGGKTWVCSEPASSNTTECMAVQLGDGAIMLNMRDNRNRTVKGQGNGRAVAITTDLGASWLVHSSSNKALQEPVCMAALHKHIYTDVQGKESHVLLFSNPNSQVARNNLTVKMSFDDGVTWPEEHHVLLDEGHGRGYSCITSIDDETIGILYESSRADLVFQRINIGDHLK